ncbi:MAG: DUF1707 SHOCT-like domain-containing protein [Marmoricola sp.]
MESSVFWATFAQDPRQPENAHLRASDRDRDAVASLLGDAYAEGRLDRDEFDERSAQVSAIRTLADIPPLVRDLVSSAPARLSPSALRVEAERRYRADRRSSLTYLGPAIICWVIWIGVLAAGHGTAFPWPIFVTFGTAMPALRLWMNPEDHIQARVHQLEKRQLRQLGQRRSHQVPDN